MRLNAADWDADGRRDVVVASKTGVYIFFNKGYPQRRRGTNWLPAARELSLPLSMGAEKEIT
jgi:hypothetical protein